MRKFLWVVLGLLGLVVLALLITVPAFLTRNRVQGAVDIFASPIQAGCYIAGPSDCRIHVEPFNINIAAGKKMVQFSLVAFQAGTGKNTVIYDWRPDTSNPPPASGTIYSPSLVTQDFAASCGSSYSVNLQGKDSGDTSIYNLGSTGQFLCPAAMP